MQPSSFLIADLRSRDETRYRIRNNCAHITIQETLAQYLALCILALASSSRFGRYHLSSVDHDTFRSPSQFLVSCTSFFFSPSLFNRSGQLFIITLASSNGRLQTRQ